MTAEEQSLSEDLGDASTNHDPSPEGRRDWRGWYAIQDIIPIVYLVVYRLLVGLSPDHPLSSATSQRLHISLAAMIFVPLLCRRVTLLPRAWRAISYRALLAYVVIVNYLVLRNLLIIISPHSFDAQLASIDEALFGVVPALWLEIINIRPIVEWFSFFYYSYFYICATYLLAVVTIVRSDRIKTEFAIGCFLLLCTGQLIYALVPGFGPIRFLEQQYAGPVNGGLFWGLVWDTVQAGSAMKDIFPSIHTAMPLWLTYFAFRQSSFDSRWTWPARITAFFTLNIIFSTVFLRWHYVIDVFAGMLLSASICYITPRLGAREDLWRKARALGSCWRF